MSDISKHLNVFTSHADGRVGKRNRLPTSCLPCRNRKLRCDRQTPCGSCVKREEPALCDYRPADPTTRTSSRSEVSIRLQHLEHVIESLIRSSHDAPTFTTPPDSLNGIAVEKSTLTPATSLSTDDSASEMVQQHSETGTHWAETLEGIHDVRQILESGDSSRMSEGHSGPRKNPLFQPQRFITMEEALPLLPSQESMDFLLTVFFEEPFLSLCYIHAVKFRREYQDFLRDANSQDLLWLSALFSILFMASKVCTIRGQLPIDHGKEWDCPALLNNARACLVSGKYLSAERYSLEALLLYTHSIYILHDPDVEPWPVLGLATRMAQKRGYHKEQSEPGFSPFQKEMRRRTWVYIETLDITMAALMGIPPITHESASDVKPPSNLRDEDFDENSKILPASRSATEYTPALFFRTKNQITVPQRQIIRHACSEQKVTVELTMQLQEMLETAHTAVPPVLRIRPIQVTSFEDQDAVVMQRLLIELQYLKAQCLLHRAFLRLDRNNASYEPSRMMCRGAATRMLELQIEYHLEIQPGARLHNSRWMFNTMMLQEFFSAAMIICLDISLREKTIAVADELEILRRSYHIWSEKKSEFDEAARAAHVLNVVIAQLSPELPRPDIRISSNQNALDFENLTLYPDVNFDQNFVGSVNPSLLDNVLGISDAIDWNIIDNYLRAMPDSMDFDTTEQPDFFVEPFQDSMPY